MFHPVLSKFIALLSTQFRILFFCLAIILISFILCNGIKYNDKTGSLIYIRIKTFFPLFLKASADNKQLRHPMHGNQILLLNRHIRHTRVQTHLIIVFKKGSLNTILRQHTVFTKSNNNKSISNRTKKRQKSS